MTLSPDQAVIAEELLQAAGLLIDNIAIDAVVDTDGMDEPAIARGRILADEAPGPAAFVIIKAHRAEGRTFAQAWISPFPRLLAEVLDETDLERLKAANLDVNTVDGPKRLSPEKARKVAEIRRRSEAPTYIEPAVPYAPPVPPLEEDEPRLTEMSPEEEAALVAEIEAAAENQERG